MDLRRRLSTLPSRSPERRRLMHETAAFYGVSQVRFQAQHSNELWQFDSSPSDLKHLKAPAWMDDTRGAPTLMLFSVVDDRKVERPFRTVKEMQETLYHFHEPETEGEANAWLFNYLLQYNAMTHRSASHARMEDWLQHLPPEGIREMCSWERFCTFARAPADPDPLHELAFASDLDAKRAIADHLGLPLAKLPREQLAALNTLLATTLVKQTV